MTLCHASIFVRVYFSSTVVTRRNHRKSYLTFRRSTTDSLGDAWTIRVQYPRGRAIWPRIRSGNPGFLIIMRSLFNIQMILDLNFKAKKKFINALNTLLSTKRIHHDVKSFSRLLLFEFQEISKFSS